MDTNVVTPFMTNSKKWLVYADASCLTHLLVLPEPIVAFFKDARLLPASYSWAI